MLASMQSKYLLSNQINSTTTLKALNLAFYPPHNILITLNSLPPPPTPLIIVLPGPVPDTAINDQQKFQKGVFHRHPARACLGSRDPSASALSFWSERISQSGPHLLPTRLERKRLVAAPPIRLLVTPPRAAALIIRGHVHL